MYIFREFVSRIWGTLRRRRTDREMDEELRLHLELAAEEAIRRGDSPERAVLAARLHAGSIPQALEQLRDQRGLPCLEDVHRDVRHAVRMLAKTPGFTAAAVLTLAIGIGASTAIFSIRNVVVLQPLPYPNPDRLIVLWTDDVKRQLHKTLVSYPLYAEWKERSHTFAETWAHEFDACDSHWQRRSRTCGCRTNIGVNVYSSRGAASHGSVVLTGGRTPRRPRCRGEPGICAAPVRQRFCSYRPSTLCRAVRVDPVHVLRAND
jgi:hypothetical protein